MPNPAGSARSFHSPASARNSPPRSGNHSEISLPPHATNTQPDCFLRDSSICSDSSMSVQNCISSSNRLYRAFYLQCFQRVPRFSPSEKIWAFTAPSGPYRHFPYIANASVFTSSFARYASLPPSLILHPKRRELSK